MQNRPARARSRLARLMDRPRAECNTIINFASPSATSPDFELPIKRRFRRQILVCCPRERFEIGVYSSSASSSSSSGSRVRIRYDTNFWSVTSSSIKVMTQTSSPNASDFFNTLFSGSPSPTAAGAQHIKNGAHRRSCVAAHRAALARSLAPAAPKAARITLALSPVDPALLLRPHRCSPSP